MAIICRKHSLQDSLANALDILASPHGFDQMMIVVRCIRIQRLDPGFQSGKNLIWILFAQLFPGLVTSPGFRAPEVIDLSFN